MRRTTLAVIMTFLVYVLVAVVINTDRGVELQRLDVRTKQAEINDLNKNIDEINQSKKSDKSRIRTLKNENKRLQGELQAKLDRQAQQARNAVYASPVQPTGNCSTWMTQAGITNRATAYKLIMKESGCNPNAVNHSSGACGIGQQLPCGKWSHVWNDPVGGLIDMQDYVMSRYGSWQSALNWHYSHNWY